jgi:hypothetical protein
VISKTQQDPCQHSHVVTTQRSGLAYSSGHNHHVLYVYQTKEVQGPTPARGITTIKPVRLIVTAALRLGTLHNGTH